jgi:WD40 repeat protein
VDRKLIESYAKDIAAQHKDISFVFGALNRFAQDDSLWEGFAVVEQRMKEAGRNRKADEELLSSARWLRSLFENPAFRFEEWGFSIAFPADRSLLAVVPEGKTLRVLDPSTMKWETEIVLAVPFLGMEFQAPDRLIVRASQEDRTQVIGDSMKVKISEHPSAATVRVVECLDPSPRIGAASHGRFSVYRRGKREDPGFLDLTECDSTPAGTRSLALKSLKLDDNSTYATQAAVSPDGRKVMVASPNVDDMERKSKHYRNLYQFLDLASSSSIRTISTHPEIRISFSWSPDGRWLAAYESELPSQDWDVPVGSTIRDYLVVLDGESGKEIWKEREWDEGDFGWTPDGLVRCGGKLRNPETGEVVSQYGQR